jgi:squalene-hopene/tetraprenyl-beta-curcumene cyclase
MIGRDELDETIRHLIAQLLDRRVAGGWWEGYLSSSALATATAVSALTLATGDRLDSGLNWLCANQNADGGWGDTVLSRSNISTTILCWCAFAIAGANERYAASVDRAEHWLRSHAGGLDAAMLVPAILRRYGNDRTFSAPILTVMAIAGKLGDGREAWRHIPQLPFELAALPHQLFGWIGLPVVSYALPALIAIGHVRHHLRPSAHVAWRALRNRLVPGTLRLLRDIQPSTGGYLEATPLTSFVLMSLAAAGMKDHAVVSEGVRFLRNSMRANSSWPIDTNLATWVTTLSVNAMSGLPPQEHPLDDRCRASIREWLLAQQYREEHPYTHAAPGGWAWTPLPGGVPDADDTAGALLALRYLGATDGETRDAARRGVRWLLDLQNRDGGMPTFCRGWGKLPFDRSGADLTAHAVAAWQACLPQMDEVMQPEIERAIGRASSYLERTQNADGSWTPLWFGNEYAPEEANPTYGTARTVIALAHWQSPMRARAIGWIEAAQNADGGWGGARGAPSSIEETALAVQALSVAGGKAHMMCMNRGVEWLVRQSGRGRRLTVSPIGLYFAKLWYFEEMYPVIFSTGALIAARAALAR